MKDDHPSALQSRCQTFLNAQGLVFSHKYYTQIQGQLFVTEKLCDFVVWIPKGKMTQRIYPNVNFIEKLSRKLTNFCVDHMLPEILKTSILACESTRTEATENSSQFYCSCRQVEYGKMIMCDSPSYKYTWFPLWTCGYSAGM